MTGMDPLGALLPVYAAYLLATASPGPSNMAIMAAAMSRGRRAALALAAGIVTGSLFWAVLAATGLSAVLAAYAEALVVIRVAGGLYLLHLAYRSARAALAASPPPSRVAEGARRPELAALYGRGVLLHLANPKAILSWIAIMSLGLSAGGAPERLAAIVGGCGVLGVAVFGGYALAFSAAPVVRAYRRARRWIEATLAVVFGVAGLRLLASRA
ncbi:MAG: LysE family translocator [Methylobacterium frigidaeris]